MFQIFTDPDVRNNGRKENTKSESGISGNNIKELLRYPLVRDGVLAPGRRVCLTHAQGVLVRIL